MINIMRGVIIKMYSNKKELQDLPDYLFNYFTDIYGSRERALEDARKIDSYARANGMKLKTKVVSQKGSGYTKKIWIIKLS